MSYKVTTLDRFAQTIYKILKSDRDVIMAVAGFTGEGKSCFLTKLQKAYAEISGTEWSYYDNMTYDREEFIGWIEGKEDKNGTIKDQKDEYTAILADELISMFYRRNWYHDGQKDAIELMNKIRDRHLFLGGAVPDFWDIDPGFQKRVRFYCYVVERGKVFVFEQENNPFTSDKWNNKANEKAFRKTKNPYKLVNFVTEIHFPDWTEEEKTEYYKIRNKKRKGTEGQNRKKAIEEKYNAGIATSKQKEARDTLIRYILNNGWLKQREIAELIGMDRGLMSHIVRGSKKNAKN